jgi:hypothetical protein
LEKLEYNENNKSSVKFSVDYNPLINLYDRFTFDYDCPFLNSLIHLKITAKHKFITKIKDNIYEESLFRSRTNVDNILTKEQIGNFFIKDFISNNINLEIDNKKIYSNFNAIKFDLSNFGEEPKIIFDGYVDISLLFTKLQYLKATILTNEGIVDKPLENAEAIIKTINFPKCPKLRMKTDKDGKLNLQKLKVFDSLEKIKYSIQFVYQGFKKTVYEFNTGGFGFSEFIDLGKIIFIKEKMDKTFFFKGKIINSINNQPENNVVVSLKTMGEFLEKSSLIHNNSIKFSFKEKKIKKKEKIIVSNFQGLFEINNLEAGVYSMSIKKDGFYEEFISRFFLYKIIF